MAKRYWINYLKEYVFTPSAPANDTTSQTGTFKALVERMVSQLSAYSGKPWYQNPDTTLSTAATHVADTTGSAHGGVYTTVQGQGTDVAKQRKLNFTGTGVTVSDDGASGRTNVDIIAGGGGGGGSAHIIQEEGSSLTARTRLNFVGAGATATDDSVNDRTNVAIRGTVTRSGTAPTSPLTGELWLDTSTSPATLREYDGATWNATSGTPRDATVTDVKVASGANIAKSKLGPLSIDTADLAVNRTLLITATSTTRPANPPEGQAIFETDTENVFINTGSAVTPVWTSITASAAYQATDFISGLQLTADGDNTLGIETGAAYIPGNSAVLEVPTRLTRAVSFAASSTSWYHVYLFSNGGSPDIDVNTTAPATPYRGKARAMTGDTTRRYLGSILPDGTATPKMHRWHWFPGDFIHFNANTAAAPFVRLVAGAAISETTISLAPVMPPTSFLSYLDADRGASGGGLYLGHSQDNVALGSNQGLFRMWDTGVDENHLTLWQPTDTSQAITYRFTATGGALFISLLGYQIER